VGTIQYVGHATVFVDLDGVRLLTDPLLRNRVAHLRRASGISARAQRGVDAVLISHGHYDHLDLPSLEKLGKKLPIVVPRGLGGLLRKKKFESVLEVEAGETLSIGDLQIRAVPAEHDRGRAPFGASADPVGYVVSGSSSIYFAGDTDLFAGMEHIGAGGLDVALLPVWGWGTGLGPGHLDPEGAARAAALLRPAIAVPIHWGTYLPAGLRRRHGGLLHTPAQQFAAAAARLAPDVHVAVLRPGEALGLGGGPRGARGHPAHPEPADDQHGAVHDERAAGEHGERSQGELGQREHRDADADVDEAAERAQQALVARDEDGPDELHDA
jgi:L-ascorbate metabolism protein UlaG (beta-lactamase superfamily)